MPVWVKICGITSVSDARLALDAGADALGLNLIPASKRSISLELAAEIHAEVGGRAEVVAVVADLPRSELEVVRARTGIRWLQLHGHEAPAALEPALPLAYKAIPIESADDVALAEGYGGDRLLTDAKVAGALGGTGRTFDWELVRSLARRRSIILAGGLGPHNVAQAISAVRPFGVDVASGVERDDPRRKDPAAMAAFVANARRAAEG